MRYIRCPECGDVKSQKQMERHRAVHLPGAVQPRRKKKPVQRPPQACKCDCGAMVEQKSAKPREFVNREHYEVWRNVERQAIRDGRRSEPVAVPQEVKERVFMEPIIRREAEWAAALEASAARMVAAQARSFPLWMDLLGLSA